jgi:hypothetical protein
VAVAGSATLRITVVEALAASGPVSGMPFVFESVSGVTPSLRYRL